MRMTDDISKLATALAKAQGEMDIAKKDSVNPHFKSRYADFAAVRDAIRVPLSANGIAYCQFVRTVEQAVEVETLIVHGESGQYMGDSLRLPLPQMTPQAVGSA